MAPLDQLLGIDGHVVPQVVKAELVVGAIGDVSPVSGLFFLTHDPVDDQADGKAHETEDLAHPFGVTLGQIVIDRNHMDALSGQGVQIGGQGGHQGLAFTGFHLSDTALVQDDAAYYLDPVGTHPKNTPSSLTAGSKSLRQNIVQGFPVGQPLLQLRGLGLELGVGEGFVLVLQGVNLVSDGIDRLQFPLGGSAE